MVVNPTAGLIVRCEKPACAPPWRGRRGRLQTPSRCLHRARLPGYGVPSFRRDVSSDPLETSCHPFGPYTVGRNLVKRARVGPQVRREDSPDSEETSRHPLGYARHRGAENDATISRCRVAILRLPARAAVGAPRRCGNPSGRTRSGRSVYVHPFGVDVTRGCRFTRTQPADRMGPTATSRPAALTATEMPLNPRARPPETSRTPHARGCAVVRLRRERYARAATHER